MLQTTVTLSQDTDSEAIRRSQRAIYIFNFAQQVSWKGLEKLDEFKIGILGRDQTALDLKNLAEKRTIFGKPVRIIRLQYVKEIEGLQLLYVNKKFNYDIDFILSKIKGEKIILVTEDYAYNSSMINIVNVGDTYAYELNENRLVEAGFTITPALRKYGITSSEHWKTLYKASRKSLEIALSDKKLQIDSSEKQIVKKEETIQAQRVVMDTMKEKVLQNQKLIRDLLVENTIQQKKYEEKLKIEQELEQNINEQISLIRLQNDKIGKSDLKISEQNGLIDSQLQEIQHQEKILENQSVLIKNKERWNTFLFIALILLSTAGFFLYRGYYQKKNLNKSLRLKNKEIYKQSEELQSKNKELEQFAYIASHDLQEPLNTISSFIGLIEEEYSDSFDEEGKTSLKFIQDASVRMRKLIDSLLEYSRLGTKEYKPVNMSKILIELQGDFNNVLKRTSAKIHSATLPVVYGNEIELRLLIQNLVSNAIKFMEEGKAPIIHIAAKQVSNDDGAEWLFSVKDNGIGIPDKHKDRIFAIFQRLHSREKYQGTGIGLAHCKKIVESHGGKIWLESKEGQGSTFYFTIPEMKV